MANNLVDLNARISLQSDAFVRGVESCRGGLRSLIASLDPVAAATAKYNRQIDQLNNALKQGKITQDDYATYTARVRQRMDEMSGSLTTVGQRSGSVRSGMQQLGFQLNDIATGFATGQKPMIIFAQQGSQVIQSLQMMTGEAKGFLGFLGGPWGLAISAAATAILPVIANMDIFTAKAKESAKAAQDFADALVKVADSAGIMDAAATSQVIKSKLTAQAKLAQLAPEIKRYQELANLPGEGGEIPAQRLAQLLAQRDEQQGIISLAEGSMFAFNRQQDARRRLSLLGGASKAVSGSSGGGAKQVDNFTGAIERLKAQTADLALEYQALSEHWPDAKLQEAKLAADNLSIAQRDGTKWTRMQRLEFAVYAGGLEEGNRALNELKASTQDWNNLLKDVAKTEAIVTNGFDMKSLADQLNKTLPKLETTWDQVMNGFGEKGRGAFDVLAHGLDDLLVRFQSLGDVARNVIQQLASMALNSFVIKPLAGALGIPAFASGTNFAPGGISLVGENGPELVNLPRGSQVVPNPQLRALPKLAMNDNAGGGRPMIFNFHYPHMTSAREQRQTEHQQTAALRRALGQNVRQGY